MIKNFKHKGLKHFYETGVKKGVPPEMIDKVELALGRLNASNHIDGMSMPQYRLHPLKGNLKGFWSVTITGNWRIIFRFDNKKGNASDVNLIDYHGK